ncbi:hypothetical protein CBR_g52424 [Chara braunii]|uniref:Reverse transcriptase domain-containing protein n=1 Tax=Chara braunii TaxID=69332 RepID=A0A388MA72_CHABU|nr:hypothetical protein CBR_g52424 [Chara braunii]|eukprot:GBG91468.1 hypothetical protein CBR_g52424 [Chara braunii]
MLLLITEAKQQSDAVAAATKKKAEDAEKAHLLAIEQQRQQDEAAAKAADEKQLQLCEKIFSGERALLTMAADWRAEAENGKLEESGNKIALLLSHLTDLLATCIAQQEDIHNLDDAVQTHNQVFDQLTSRLQQLEQTVAAPVASSSNTSDRLKALEIGVGSLKDDVQFQQTATQQLEQRICTVTNHSSSEPCETTPKFDGKEIFCDSTKTNPIPWFRKFELTLQLHYVSGHKHHAVQVWSDFTIAVTSNEAGNSATAAAPRLEPAGAGPSHIGPYVDRKAVQIPSKYDGKEDIESWINSMRAYFKVLGTQLETQSVIMGMDVEPVVLGFLEVRATRDGIPKIELTRWLKTTPVASLEELLISQYLDPHAAARARIQLDKIKRNKWTGSMKSLQTYLSKMFPTPRLKLTAQSCLDVVKGAIPTSFTNRLGRDFIGYTDWFTLMKDIVSLEAVDLVTTAGSEKPMGSRQFKGSNRFVEHDLLEAEEEPDANDPTLGDDQEQDSDTTCSLAHESDANKEEEKFTAFKKTTNAKGLNQSAGKNYVQLPKGVEIPPKPEDATTKPWVDLRITENDWRGRLKKGYEHFEWVVMPFGLTNAPTTFQAAMTNEFRTMLDRFVLVYLDDIFIYSRSLEDHLEHLRRVLETLRLTKYKANLDKCGFVRQELEYLGHFVTPESISPLSDKIQAIQEWPEPRNVTDVRSFLGLAVYYQRFIKGYSKIAAYLSKLQCEDRPFDFGEDAWESFLALKAALLSAEVFRIYNLLLPTHVTVDASRYGIGAVLERHDGMDWHPVEYFSKKVSVVHSIDDARKKELLAFVPMLKLWRHFLLGRSQFRWVTDNNPLVFYKTQDTVNSTITRWMTFIDQFDFFPDHISGKNLPASEARLEYHSFETLSRKALDLEATLGNAQPSLSDARKKKSLQEWKKKGAKLMMVESDGTQTEIDELTDLLDVSEYDGEETAEGSTLAAVVKAKHAMNRIFHDHLDKFVVVYLDDILIFSKSAEEHAEHVETVLSLLRQHKYKVNLEKCEFGRTKILYLGHEVSAEGIRPEDAKVASIQDWPRPQTATEVRSFLGMCGYYRNFVKNYSTVASPLTDLTRLDTPWDWSDECEGAFKRLKHALMNHEVLMVPDPQKPFIVTTDASQYGIGAVVAQQDGKKLRPIEYMSKKMPSKKLAKSTYERELYALYKALVHWRHFLLEGQSVSMDFMDTLVTSKSGKRHIFVIIDRFTKYARLVAMPETARTDHVIKLFMDNWVRDFRLPKSIVRT